jgi:hypothetical protein
VRETPRNDNATEPAQSEPPEEQATEQIDDTAVGSAVELATAANLSSAPSAADILEAA